MKLQNESIYYPYPIDDNETSELTIEKLCFSVALEYLLENKLPTVNIDNLDIDSDVNLDVIKDNW